MKAKQILRFRLAITADKYLSYYQGRAQAVITRAEDGSRLEFPANAVQRFLRHEGIHGLFEISFDENNKLIGLERIGD